MHPIFPHTLEHLRLMSADDELEHLASLTHDDLKRITRQIGEECQNVINYLLWVSEDELHESPSDSVLYRLCVGIHLDELKGSSKTLRALFVVPPIEDRIVTRPRKACKRVTAFYLDQLDQLVQSAYPDTVLHH